MNLFTQEFENLSAGTVNIKNPEGKEFWLCFEKNFKGIDTNKTEIEMHLELFITGNEGANVRIEIPRLRFRQNLFVPGKTVKSIMINPYAELESSEKIEEQMAVHIISDKPVTVYGLNRMFQTTDTFLGLPTDVLGMEYRAICYSVSDGLVSQFAAVATEANTKIEITPKVATINHKGGKPFTVYLNQGDVYQVTAKSYPAYFSVAGNKKQETYINLSAPTLGIDKSIFLGCDSLKPLSRMRQSAAKLTTPEEWFSYSSDSRMLFDLYSMALQKGETAFEKYHKITISSNIPVFVDDGFKQYESTSVTLEFYVSQSDLTGSLIKSNKKISVFSGHECSYVPPKIIACNHLVEQMPPVNAWGKHYYIGILKGRSAYTYRALANEPNTKVFEDNKLLKTLGAGEYLERTLNRNIQLTADKPILVAQYSQGYTNGDSVGDPMMLLISPTQQFLRQYRFATPINGNWDHYINVVALTNSISSMKLNGLRLDSSQFAKLGLSRYSIAHIRIPFGTHIIEGSEPFGMYSYGFGSGSDAYDAYGNMGGQSFLEYIQKIDTIPPAATVQSTSGRKMKIIIRDDRVDDMGIKSFKVLMAKGIDVTAADFEQGVQQLPVTAEVTEPKAESYAIIEAVDMSKNSALFTICYSSNEDTGLFSLNLYEGESKDCIKGPEIRAGIFGRISGNYHLPGFSSTGNIKADGTFQSDFSAGGYFGILGTIKYSNELQFSAKLSYESLGGILTAPDTLNRNTRSPSGEIVPYRTAHEIDFKGRFINLDFSAEWLRFRNFYLLGGLSFNFAVSDEITLKRKALTPEFKALENGQREIIEPINSLSTLSVFKIGIFAGGGFQYPLIKRFDIFAEVMYNYNFNSMLSDGGWTLHRFIFQAGIKYKM